MLESESSIIPVFNTPQQTGDFGGHVDKYFYRAEAPIKSVSAGHSEVK